MSKKKLKCPYCEETNLIWISKYAEIDGEYTYKCLGCKNEFRGKITKLVQVSKGN